ncbi:hypothetical protein I9Y33_001357 [Clostridium perfringens]|nr:hypothetical protein [Clostridium perfringens]
MIKFIGWVNLVLGIIVLPFSYYKDYFKDPKSTTLVFIILVLNVIIGCITKQYQSLNNRLEKEKEKIESKDKEIRKLNMKLSETLMNSNEGSPYQIQEYIWNLNENCLSVNKDYKVSIIVSTLNNDYGITYLNLIFNKHLKLKQNDENMKNSDYVLDNDNIRFRNERFEHSFKFDYNEKGCNVAMCEFTLNHDIEDDVEMIIEVLGQSLAIDRKKEITLKFIKS